MKWLILSLALLLLIPTIYADESTIDITIQSTNETTWCDEINTITTHNIFMYDIIHDNETYQCKGKFETGDDIDLSELLSAKNVYESTVSIQQDLCASNNEILRTERSNFKVATYTLFGTLVSSLLLYVGKYLYDRTIIIPMGLKDD